MGRLPFVVTGPSLQFAVVDQEQLGSLFPNLGLLLLLLAPM